MSKLKSPSSATFWEQITQINRLWRLLLVAMIAIITTLAVSPLIDAIYLQFFFTPETRIVPSLIAMGVGTVMYILGWFYLVGSAGQTMYVTRGLKWYIYASFLMVIIVVLWMIGLLLASL